MKRLAFVFALLGCDFEETTQQQNTAPLYCDRAVASICNKVAACSTIAAGDCAAALRRDLNCARAVGVGDSYNRCLGEVGASTCSGLAGANGELVLPASCHGIILVQ